MKFIVSVAVSLALSLPSSDTLGGVITYQLNGQLEEGGRFFGTFKLSADAPDTSTSDGFGRYELFDVAVRLVDTELFFSGGNTATSGFTTSGRFFQSESGQKQSLSLNFRSDSGNSGVFTSIDFGPFVGDADVVNPLLTDAFIEGYFDGAGQSSITEIDVSAVPAVPEPCSAMIFLLAIALVFRRREKATAEVKRCQDSI